MSADEDFLPYLKKVAGGERLDAESAARAFGIIMSGGVSDIPLAGFLTALTVRGPAVSEITGASRAMRAAMTSVESTPHAIDLCGTGGDGHGTLNISTAAAFAVAGAGVPVAKHGNRNMSSRTGTADALEALGVKIALTAQGAQACLREAGICFLFAQSFHPAVRHVAGVRKGLGFRTIFNLLGPISNPARVRKQLLGVFAKEWIVPVAEVLKELGTERAWVVHGGDGLDEMTTTGVTHAAILEDGKISLRDFTPEEFGLKRATLADLKGGDAPENAAAIKRLLAGEKSAYRDIVVFNAGAALTIAGKTEDLKTGIAEAVQAIDSGKAAGILDKLIAVSQRQA